MVVGRIAVSLGGGDENVPLQEIYFGSSSNRVHEVNFYQDTDDIVNRLHGEKPFDIVVCGYTQLRGEYNDVASLAEAVRKNQPEILMVACLPSDSDLIRGERVPGSEWVDGVYQYDIEKLAENPKLPEAYGNLALFLVSPESVELARRSRKNDDYLDKIEKTFPFIKTYYDRRGN